MCLNLPTGVPTSGCCDCSQRVIGSSEQFAGLLGQPRQHRGQVDGQLAEQVQPDRADVVQLVASWPGPCAGSTARRCSMNWFARSPAAMISRIARL